MTELTTLDDRQWLLQVHLKHVRPQIMTYDFVCATLHGNEDSPRRVELFKKDHYRCIPWVYVPNDDGLLMLDAKASVGAGKLRPRTKQEKDRGCL